MAKQIEQRTEFSRPVVADRIGESELVKEIAASEVERAALAARFGWLSLARLAATVRLRRVKRGLIRVSGRYEAEVEQACVVTLAPVPVRILGELDLLYAPEEVAAEAGRTAAAVDEDPPEPIEDGRIDIGEAVVQQLAVTLDPYPRAPGAALPEGGGAGSRPAAEEGPDRTGPFAVLAGLKGGGRG